jgi:hypothetical protein
MVATDSGPFGATVMRDDVPESVEFRAEDAGGASR